MLERRPYLSASSELHQLPERWAKGNTSVLIGRNNWSRHRAWIIFALIALVGMSVVYAVAARGSLAWPGGSSLVGFSFGVLGGLIILFECLLWVRKNWLRT